MSGQKIGHEIWDDIPASTEVEERRIHTIFYSREEGVGASAVPGGVGGVHQRSVDEEDRTVSEVIGYRESIVESGEYLVLWIDAMYEKIRTNGRVINMAVLIVTGINYCGIREILAVEPVYRGRSAPDILSGKLTPEEGMRLMANRFRDKMSE